MAMTTVTDLLAGKKLDLKSITSRQFAAKYMAAVKPMSDGATYSCISEDGKRIEVFSFKNGKKVSTLFDAETVRGAKIEWVEGYQLSPDGNNVLIQTDTKYIYRRSFTAQYYIYNVRNNKMVPLSEGGAQQMPLFSPDGQQIAFVRDNNLFLVKLLYDNAESQITKDGKRNEIINGLPDWVYEEEFATNRSFVFTADSKQICWIRYDESKVKEYSFALYKGSNPTEDRYADYPGAYSYKYPIAGEKNSQVAVYSFDIKSRQTRKLQVPVEADGYIPRLMMTADATKVAVFTLNRHQDELAIYMANPLSTVAQMVLQEKADKYIRFEAMDGIQITDRHILMPSDRDGYNHLDLYTLGGRLERKITN